MSMNKIWAISSWISFLTSVDIWIHTETSIADTRNLIANRREQRVDATLGFGLANAFPAGLLNGFCSMIWVHLNWCRPKSNAQAGKPARRAGKMPMFPITAADCIFSTTRAGDRAAGHRHAEYRGRSWSGCRSTHLRRLLQSLAQRQRKAGP